MLEGIIEKFILGGCNEEVKRYNRNYKKSNCNLDCDEDQWSYMVEIMIITIKSLVPCSSSYGSIIDYNRFNEELKLWYYYRHGENDCLINKINNDIGTYWSSSDDSLYSRIIPIIFANEDWLVVKDQVLKNILYTTGKISLLLEGLAIAKIFFILIGNINIDFDELISKIKEEIIDFSQKDFIEKYSVLFSAPLNNYKGSYTVDFERKRIELLNTLNEIDKGLEYNTLKKIIEILKQPEKEHDVSGFLLHGLLQVKMSYMHNTIKDEEFIRNLCGFLFKLRKGRIPAESLYIDHYSLPDVFQYKEGDIFFHTLLKKCQVIKKIKDKGAITSYIRTKSGTYRFIKASL